MLSRALALPSIDIWMLFSLSTSSVLVLGILSFPDRSVMAVSQAPLYLAMVSS